MMKYLLLVVLVVVAYLVWRNARLQRRSEAPPTAAEPLAQPQEMVSCPVCGLHLPRPDAVAGSNGRFYCTQDHRARAGS